MAFGGDINQNSVQEKSPDTDNLYYLLNFNSYGASLVTLFHFMVINNWFVTIDMYEEVNDGSMFPTFYFVLFWVCVVLILLNVLIALILEIYSAVEPEIQNKTKKRAEGRGKREEGRRKREEGRGKREVLILSI